MQSALRTCSIKHGLRVHLAQVEPLYMAADKTLCGIEIYNMPPSQGLDLLCVRCAALVPRVPNEVD